MSSATDYVVVLIVLKLSIISEQSWRSVREYGNYHTLDKDRTQSTTGTTTTAAATLDSYSGIGVQAATNVAAHHSSTPNPHQLSDHIPPAYPDHIGMEMNETNYNSSMVVCKSSFMNTINGNVLVKEYMCSICGKSFKTTKDCKRHTIIHSSSKPFSCPYCDHTANLSFNLKKHIQKRHPTDYLEYPRGLNI